MDHDDFLISAYARIRQSASVPVQDPTGNPAINNNATGDNTTTAAAAATGTTAPPPPGTLPSPAALAAARASLPRPPPPTTATEQQQQQQQQDGPPRVRQRYLEGRGPSATLRHLLEDICPALNGQARSGRYHGFVTGGVLPVAEAADNLVSAWDQNVQVHLPAQTIATEVEDAALEMVGRLLGIIEDDDDDDTKSQGSGSGRRWEGRTFTTGATASNILGLACGREAVVAARAERYHPTTRTDDEEEEEEDRIPAASASVGELGLLAACARAGVRDIQVLTSMGHSSLSKAAAVAGLGRGSVKQLSPPLSPPRPWILDLDAVERELARSRDEGVVSIVAVSAGEVNTGGFATPGGLGDMRRLRDMADRYGAWVHVDGAFGIFARILPDTPEFARLREQAGGLELADSITVDGHKFLNVPYDNGIFFTRRSSILTSVCQNPNAAYLTGGSGGGDGIQSPLNVGLENSRRFRALPVYAALLSEGASGLAEMQVRMVRLARAVARWIRTSDDYVLLPAAGNGYDGGDYHSGGDGPEDEDIHMVTLFRARDESLNAGLVSRINASRQWYVSGTSWEGRPACRVAVASWRVDVERDFAVIRDILVGIAEEAKAEAK